MASMVGAAYHVMRRNGNPFSATLDGSQELMHDVQSLIKRASNCLEESDMLAFLESLSSVLLLKDGVSHDGRESILGLDQYLWFPLRRNLITAKWIGPNFMEAYKDACIRLVLSTKEEDPHVADSIRKDVFSDLTKVFESLQ